MKFCPRCGCDLSPYLAAETQQPVAQEKYDQTKVWKQIIAKVRERVGAGSPPTLMELVEPAAQVVERLFNQDPKGTAVETIVHIAFDHDIVPAGGVLYRAVVSDGKMGMPLEQLQHLGYAIENDKVVLVDDVPVSQAYAVLDYWGGEKQHRRWHLSRPLRIDPSRSGNPFFMDGEMIAFGASWFDSSKVRVGLLNLLDLFARGIKGEKAIAHPFALEIAQAT